MFVVLALVLRRKPDALVNVLPTLREGSKYQGQDKLVFIVWMIAQVTKQLYDFSSLQDGHLYPLFCLP
jgi:hypothetical protein